MPISLTPEAAVFEGHVDITDIDQLHPWMVANTDAVLDVTECTSAHTAVVQIVVASGMPVKGAEDTGDWRSIFKKPHSVKQV